MYISNGGQSAINETNMNKINGNVKMKISAKNPATAHILDRCMPFKKICAKRVGFLFNIPKTGN